MPLQGKYLLIALDVIVRQMPLKNGVSIVHKLVKLSNTDNVFATGGNNIVEVFDKFLDDKHTVV